MPQRRPLVLGAVALVIVGAAAAAVALSTGPAERVSRAYSGHRTFVSQAVDVCVDVTIKGTAVGTRSGTAPLTRWTGVRLLDPTITAAGYAVDAGRCDRTKRVGLGATLEQRWTGSGDRVEVRRSVQRPVVGTTSQFNSGSPVELDDRGFPASVLGSDYAITGRITVEARSTSGSEGFGFPVRIDLSPQRSRPTARETGHRSAMPGTRARIAAIVASSETPWKSQRGV